MTPDAFRTLALSFPRTKQVHVLGTQEFRIADRAFATLGWPEPGWAVVKLSPDDQQRLTSTNRGLCPEPGGRGKRGVTRVHLDRLDEAALKLVLTAAWRNLSTAKASTSA